MGKKPARSPWMGKNPRVSSHPLGGFVKALFWIGETKPNMYCVVSHMYPVVSETHCVAPNMYHVIYNMYYVASSIH